MGSKNITFLINLHHPYIKLEKADFAEFEEEGSLIFQSISNFYLPLLTMLSKFEKEKANVRFALVFSSSLCAFLSDDEIKKKYNKWLDNLAEFAKKEIVRAKKDSAIAKLAQANLATALENKRLFNEVYNCDLLAAFADLEQKGLVEILATCGTYLFMPHFIDLGEVLNAQVESGLYAIRTYFGKNPDGFFLPEMGYAQGVEGVLKLYGVEYTILPKQSFLFSKIPPQNGIFMPARCLNSLTIFAADEFVIEQDGVYKDTTKDLAWELSHKELTPFVKEGRARHGTGFSYHNKAEETYDPKAARARAQEYAANFIQEKDAVLLKAQELLGSEADVSLSFYIDGLQFAHGWAEGFEFLESAVRAAVSKGINVTSYSNLAEGKFGMQKIMPYPAACTGSPYGENLVSSENSWMVRYLRKASERIVDLVSRFPNDGGLKARLLNLGAKELMLVQDCTFSKMVDSHSYANFAAEFFKRGVVSFSNVYDSLGSNTVSTEWFCDLEKRHPIFPWMNYRIFAKKR